MRRSRQVSTLQAIQRAALDRLEYAQGRVARASMHPAVTALCSRAGKAAAAVHGLFRRAWPGRSLIAEILALQVVFALIVGGVAIVGLWWASTWAIEDNLKKWGERWITELDDIGVSIYTASDDERYLRVESYIRSFPEISFVRYYQPDGEVIFEDFPVDVERAATPLGRGYLQRLSREAKSSQPVVLPPELNDSRLMRMSKPIRAQSFVSDGMIGIDMANDASVQTELIGFVELGLNFSTYQSQLSRNIVLGSLLGMLLLMFLTSVTAVLFRRALRPLSQLQNPLKELARGRMDFSVQTSGHKEIVAITDALNATMNSLHERDKKLWQLANHDSLTGLMNRHQFGEMLCREVEKVGRSKRKSALLFVDLDQFKYVNDTLGHAAGDRLLKQAAEKLRNGIRKVDLVSRFGGDEFTILLSEVAPKDVKLVCASLLQGMRDFHFHEDGHTFNIPCSIGVAMITSGNLTPAELLARADMACHEAKSRGRNRFQFYKASGAETKQMTADVGWSQHIKKALREDLFTILYQPIVEVRTGRPTHFEALLRMRTEDGQLVPPNAFLPAANRFGLMTDVDEWVIRNATKALARYRKSDPQLRFTLNISGNIFEDADLYRCIEKNLGENGLPAESVVLEITEQIAIRNMTNAAEQIAAISGLGCQFAIDDFGAGYSSYTYLKTLPVDYIKIDGSFIKNLADDDVDKTIVKSISEIARTTNKKTIAEHVLNEHAFRVLFELGVDYAQGFYVGKPADTPARRAIPVPIETARQRKKTAG